jgi:uncharacterized membrane protein YfcA
LIPTFHQLGAWQWVIALLGAFLIGLSKTGFPGLGMLAISLYSNVFPPVPSAGLVLILLISADIVAVSSFHRHAHWNHLWRLFPWSMSGVVAGYLAVQKLPRQSAGHLIGAILAVLGAYQLWQWGRKGKGKGAMGEGPLSPKQHLLFAACLGLAAGFTTMVANAAGPIMVIYLLAMGLPKMEFIGTGAWYFLLMNCFKVPFSYSLGFVNFSSLSLDLFLAPLAVAGAFLGKYILPYVPQRLFELMALLLTLAASLKLLI